MAEGSIPRAAIYCRMSTDDQEDSIDRQLSQARPHCDRKGYRVAGEPYTDEGIAGDEFERRHGLQKLLRDAAAGLFDVVVVDEVSRLSRQKFTEFMARVAYPLEQAGVTLDSVAEGTLAWDEAVDIIKLSIYQPQAHGESRKLSYRVLTGQANAARQKRLLGGVRPYGYRTEYRTVEAPGQPPKLVPVRLVPDGHKADVVRWVFETYAAGRLSLREIAVELNARAAPPPGRNNRKRGRTASEPVWTPEAVRSILHNPRYTGCLTWNRSRRGKYHRLSGGRPVKAPRSRGFNDCGDWEVVEGAHEPLVSRETFDAAQARLTTRGRGGRGTPSRRGYLLSRLLQCGHCGRTLRGNTTPAGGVFYRCEGYDGTGRRVCGLGRIRQDAVVNLLVGKIQQTFLDPKNLRRLRAEIRRQEEAKKAPDNTAALKASIAELERKVKQGRENLAILPADQVPGVVAVVRGWERERDRLRGELERVHTESRTADLETVIANAERCLWNLREAIGRADPTELSDTIRRMVARIEVNWEHRPHGKLTRYVITGGVIHLRSGALDGRQGGPETTGLPKTGISTHTSRTGPSLGSPGHRPA